MGNTVSNMTEHRNDRTDHRADNDTWDNPNGILCSKRDSAFCNPEQSHRERCFSCFSFSLFVFTFVYKCCQPHAERRDTDGNSNRPHDFIVTFGNHRRAKSKSETLLKCPSRSTMILAPRMSAKTIELAPCMPSSHVVNDSKTLATGAPITNINSAPTINVEMMGINMLGITG